MKGKALLCVALALFCLSAVVRGDDDDYRRGNRELTPRERIEVQRRYQPWNVPNGATLAVAIGEDGILRVPLAENPSTGYIWTVTTPNPMALQQVRSDFFCDNPGGAVGVPGVRIFSFKGQGGGSATLTFTLVRGQEAPTKSFTLLVTVEDDGDKRQDGYRYRFDRD